VAALVPSLGQDWNIGTDIRTEAQAQDQDWNMRRVIRTET
jgi:hypothetical protein